MIGLVRANPSILMVSMKYAKFRPKLVFTGNSKDLAELARFFYDVEKNQDERKLVIFFEGGYNVFKKVRDVKSVAIKVTDPADPTGKTEKEIEQAIDLQKAILVIVDQPTVLATLSDVTIADAKEKVTTINGQTYRTWDPVEIDCNELLEQATVGFKKRDARDQLELAELFDPQLQKIEDEKQRQRAARWLAARVEGVLDDESWEKAVTKMQTFGVETEIIVGALRLLKTKGRLDALQKATKRASVAVQPSEQEKAAKEFKVPFSDLKWLDQHWPLENLKGGG